MRRLWPALLCLFMMTLVGMWMPSRRRSITESYTRDIEHGHEICYLCGSTVGYLTETTPLVGARYESWPRHWVKAYITICDTCVSRHGWPLSQTLQEEARKNWQTVEIEYYGPLFRTKPHVWQRRLKQIQSIRLTEQHPETIP